MAKVGQYPSIAAAIPLSEQRSIERLKYHYEVEKRLANRLRHATRDERRYLYSSVYNELYRLVPDHPGLAPNAKSQTYTKVGARLRFLNRFLRPDCTFLELGPGDCSLSFEVAKKVKKVYAVDVTDAIIKNLACPHNFEFFLSDGCTVSVPEGRVNVAFSDQLMEHVHPDDALEQLHYIFRSLAPGGIYICLTPNRLSGPHDISTYFDETATGFHLREYTNTELTGLLTAVGFSNIKTFIRTGGKLATLPPVPLLPTLWAERVLETLPYTQRRRLARSIPVSLMLGVRLLAEK